MNLWLKSKLKEIKLKDVLLVLLVVFGFFYLKSCGKEETPSIINVPKSKNVINNIEKKEKSIHTFEKQIYNKEATEKMLNGFKQEMFLELEKYRQTNDLPSIVRIQDSIIHIQQDEIGNLQGIIGLKDSVIIAQRFIIDSKDTLLSISDSKVKKFKRQRNLLALIAIVEAGIIIVK